MTTPWQSAAQIAELFLVNVWQNADQDMARRILSPDVVRRHARSPSHGFDAYWALVENYHRAFPGFTNEVLHVTGDLDSLAVHYRSAGTHTGWWGKIPPSYRSGRIEAIDLYKMRDGKMIEVIPMWDELGIVQQLGLTMVNPFFFVRSAVQSLIRAVRRPSSNQRSPR